MNLVNEGVLPPDELDDRDERREEQERARRREIGNLDALERACEEVLDAETLKRVVAAKVRIQKGGAE